MIIDRNREIWIEQIEDRFVIRHGSTSMGCRNRITAANSLADDVHRTFGGFYMHTSKPRRVNMGDN